MAPEERSAALDGLRGLAVALVIVWHTLHLTSLRNWFSPLAPGPAGVRMFFVLSGFLITGILLRARVAAAAQAVSRFGVWRAFHIRRLLRIFPLAYVAIALVCLVGAQGMRERSWEFFAYVSNFEPFFCVSCRDVTLGHFWSLATEEQFYLLWPLLILWLPRERLPLVISGVIVCSAMFRGAIIHWMGESAAYVLLPARLDSLALGGLLAVLLQDGWCIRRLTSWCAAAGVVLLFAGIGHPGVRAGVFDESGMMALSAAAMLWLSASPQARIGRLFASRPLVALGMISYGIYVWQGIVPELALLARQRLHVGLWIPLEMGPPDLLFVFCSSILVASLSWMLVERPLNNLKRYFPYVRFDAHRGVAGVKRDFLSDGSLKPRGSGSLAVK